MVDRYRVWLGAGVLAGGVSAAVLAGAGVAAADDGSSSASGATASSGARHTAGATESGSRSAATGRGGVRRDDGGTSDSGAGADTASARHVKRSTATADGGSGTPDGGSTTTSADTGSPTSGEEAAPGPVRTWLADAAERAEARKAARAEKAAATAGDADTAEAAAHAEDAETVATHNATAAPGGATDVGTTTPVNAVDGHSAAPAAAVSETDLGSRAGAAVMRIAAAQAPRHPATPAELLAALNAVTTRVYNLFTTTMANLGGPVRAPFGSTVRVESSTLDLGNGVTVPADWYFPDHAQPPVGVIYLQHGFLATAAFYSVTASYLADKTNSIVVAPTLTWNLFDVDSYPLEWPATGKAVAALFAGDRAALTASARAAGYVGTLPTRVVLAGHSAGGGLVVMAARYMAEAGNAAELAGVVLFDGVATFSPMTQDLAAIPLSVPVYNLAAQPSTWNLFGDTGRRLAQVRPGMFTGVMLDGGKHSDGMQTTSPLVQWVAYLATGFSSPLDVMANRVLAAGWINDMFDGTHVAAFYDGDSSASDIMLAWWWHQLQTSIRAGAAHAS